MNNLFFELLQVALGTRVELSRVPNAHEWGAMYNEAERQAVVGVMLSGLERLPAEQLPPIEVKLQWIGMVQMIEAEYRLHCERAVELTRRFRSVGFQCRVLKGVGMAQYYPEPARRQCGDIDLWVDGRREDVIKWLRTQCKIEHHVWHHVDALFFKDVSVEVHVHPAWMYGPSRNRILQKFFDCELFGCHETENTGLGFNVPTIGFDAVFSLVHSFHHLLEEGVGLRHIIDYYYILLKFEGESIELREETFRVTKSIGLGKFTAAMMWVLRDVCGMPASELLCEPNENEGKFLLKEIMAGGNFGQTRQDGKDRNTIRRWMMMVKHYPCEVLWIVPWKVWHRVWMAIHN